MDTVYIWGHHDITGHASIAYDATGYISFHPNLREPGDRRKVFEGKTFPYKFSELEEDLRNSTLVNKIRIDWLDDAKISKYLSERADKEMPHYCLYSHNCSAAVARLLIVGAGADFDPHKTLHGAWQSLKAKFHHKFLDTEDPDRIIEGIRDHIEDYAVVGARRMLLVNPLARAIFVAFTAVDVGTRLLVWTPGAVKEFAEGLAKHNKSKLSSD